MYRRVDMVACVGELHALALVHSSNPSDWHVCAFVAVWGGHACMWLGV